MPLLLFLRYKKLRNEAFPFDWHLSTLEQVYNVLESDFENFMDDFHFLDHNPFPGACLVKEGDGNINVDKKIFKRKK